jgi:hypothetical protein
MPQRFYEATGIKLTLTDRVYRASSREELLTEGPPLFRIFYPATDYAIAGFLSRDLAFRHFEEIHSGREIHVQIIISPARRVNDWTLKTTDNDGLDVLAKIESDPKFSVHELAGMTLDEMIFNSIRAGAHRRSHIASRIMVSDSRVERALDRMRRTGVLKFHPKDGWNFAEESARTLTYSVTQEVLPGELKE